MPNNSSVRLTSNRPFWGLSSYDSAGGLASDWGHAWLGVRFLQKDYTLAYSPGTQFAPVTTVAKTAGGVVTLTTRYRPQHHGQLLDPRHGYTDCRLQRPIHRHRRHGQHGHLYLGRGAGGVHGYHRLVERDLRQPRCHPPVQLRGTVPNSYNRDPVWVAGTQDNTQVRVDLDADSLWDFIDTDSDGCPNTGDAAGTSCRGAADLACRMPRGHRGPMCLHRQWARLGFSQRPPVCGIRTTSTTPAAASSVPTGWPCPGVRTLIGLSTPAPIHPPTPDTPSIPGRSRSISCLALKRRSRPCEFPWPEVSRPTPFVSTPATMAP